MGNMATITVGDVTGTADLGIAGDSMLGRNSLQNLKSATAKFVSSFSTSLADVVFQPATLGAEFKNPAISLDAERTLNIKAGANVTLARYAAGDSPLLGTDAGVPDIGIGPNEYWLSFALKGTLAISVGDVPAPGFGVSVKDASAVALTHYTRFSRDDGSLPSLAEAIEITLNNFGLLLTAKDIRDLKPGTVRSSDVSGTVTVSGSYTLPIAVNQLALAESLVPFKIQLNPQLTVKLGGSVAMTSDYSVRCWRKSETELVLALLKKKGAQLTAKFTAGAGLGANLGDTDLIEAFFSKVAPKIDLRQAGLTPEDPRYDAIDVVLSDSINRAFEVSINAACAASLTDQTAFVYSIDLAKRDAAKATDEALQAVLTGDWSQLAGLPNAKELRNVVASSRDIKRTLTVNLLGIFNYQTVEDFIRSSTILHNDEDASVTITDKATARRIATASTPLLADSEKLRAVLYECMLLTAVYTLAGGKFTVQLGFSQSLRIYKARMSEHDLKKILLLAVLLRKLTSAQLNSLNLTNPAHIVAEASQTLGGDLLQKLFFADAQLRTPHDISKLTALGRRTLASLLDPANDVDRRRTEVLMSDSVWAGMNTSGGKAPQSSPASYSDWYDVTFWANALHNIGPPLKAVLDAADRIPAGSDPSLDQDFTTKRDTLRKAMGEVTHDTHAAFEHTWPIAVTCALAGGDTGATMTGAWNGVPQIPLPSS
jgi:hypothetical protein